MFAIKTQCRVCTAKNTVLLTVCDDDLQIPGYNLTSEVNKTPMAPLTCSAGHALNHIEKIHRTDTVAKSDEQHS